MPHKDIRQFITALEKSRDVVHIKKEVDWDLEAGAIIRRTNELRGSAPFFEKISDYSSGYRIFGTPLATHRRFATALGVNADMPRRNIQAEYEKKVKNPAIKPIVVKSAPCKENIALGKDVNLHQFPSPILHEGDGGRYIGTWHLFITKDPDSDWTNWGMYRIMVYNERLLSISLHHANDGGKLLFEKFEPGKKPMPFAVAIGTDPLCTVVAASPFDVMQSEADYAGTLRGEPVELIKCETSDLLVPAHSEIIIEGETLPGVAVPEGPFGERSGYRTEIRPRPAGLAKAITWRTDPILTATCMGIPLTDGSVFRALSLAAYFKEVFRQHNLPVTDVHLPEETVQQLAIIAIKRGGREIISRIKSVISSHKLDMVNVIVVEDDVDIFDLGQIFHVLATKLHPVRGVLVSQNQFLSGLTTYLSPQERLKQEGPTILFDCTWPEELSRETDVPLRMSFNEAYPGKIRNKVLKNWESYGF